MKPDIDQVYAVLRQWTAAGEPQTYTDLSHDYRRRTGDWFPPHRSWRVPLSKINGRLASVGAPALSALVVLKATNKPGDGFWGCAPNVPSRPRTEIDRYTRWRRIVDKVIDFDWPQKLPGPSE